MFAQRTKWNLASNRLSEALARHRASGRPLIDLTVSDPTEAGFLYDGESILDALRHTDALQYHPDPQGLPAARRAVVEYYSQRGADVSIEDIVLTTSTSEAYSFVFRMLCDPGDEILVPGAELSAVRFPRRYSGRKAAPLSLVPRPRMAD